MAQSCGDETLWTTDHARHRSVAKMPGFGAEADARLTQQVAVESLLVGRHLVLIDLARNWLSAGRGSLRKIGIYNCGVHVALVSFHSPSCNRQPVCTS